MDQRRFNVSNTSTQVDEQFFNYRGAAYTRTAVLQMIADGTITDDYISTAVQFLRNTAPLVPPSVPFDPNAPGSSQQMLSPYERRSAFQPIAAAPSFSQSMPIAYVAPTPQPIIIDPNPIGYIISSPP